MEFNESKFEHMTTGNSNLLPPGQYTTPSGDEIQNKDTVRDRSVITSKDLDFKEHINKITTDCLVIMGMLLRTFETRARGPMILCCTTPFSEANLNIAAWFGHQVNNKKLIKLKIFKES